MSQNNNFAYCVQDEKSQRQLAWFHPTTSQCYAGLRKLQLDVKTTGPRSEVQTTDHIKTASLL